jgi:hypothetical protein
VSVRFDLLREAVRGSGGFSPPDPGVELHPGFRRKLRRFTVTDILVPRGVHRVQRIAVVTVVSLACSGRPGPVNTGRVLPGAGLLGTSLEPDVKPLRRPCECAGSKTSPSSSSAPVCFSRLCLEPPCPSTRSRLTRSGSSDRSVT